MSGLSATIALAVVLALGGFPWRQPGEEGRGAALVRAFLTGALVLHLTFELLDAIGWRWSIAPLATVAAAVQLLAFRCRDRTRPAPVEPPGWGDAVALASVGIFVTLALNLEAVTPDFVYHWGSKARRFAAVGGFDLDFLALPSAFRLQPQYPCLSIDLAALPGALLASRSIAASLVPSLAAFALMPVIAHDLLARTGARSWVRSALVATWTLALTRFAIGHRMGGQADLLLSLAVVAAVPALVDPRRAGATREIALAAAVAAAAKAEGLAIAFLLVAIHVADGAVAAARSGRARSHLARRLALPLFAVTVSAAPWLVRNARFDLAGDELVGGYRWQRTAEAVGEISRWFASSAAPEWSVWPIVALAAIPLLLWRRWSRPVGLLATGVVAVGVAAYSGGAPEVGRWVALSFPRLLFHWVPAVLLALAIAVARSWPARSER